MPERLSYSEHNGAERDQQREDNNQRGDIPQGENITSDDYIDRETDSLLTEEQRHRLDEILKNRTVATSERQAKK
jgi:hypothetical protein